MNRSNSILIAVRRMAQRGLIDGFSRVEVEYNGVAENGCMHYDVTIRIDKRRIDLSMYRTNRGTQICPDSSSVQITETYIMPLAMMGYEPEDSAAVAEDCLFHFIRWWHVHGEQEYARIISGQPGEG